MFAEDDRGEGATLAIDLGKTSCRARVTGDDAPRSSHAPGAPGLAGYEGLERARTSVDEALEELPADLLPRVRRVGVGAAGVEANPEAARLLAEHIAARLTASVVVVSDALTAHAGALAGASGAILIAGTGAIAFRLDQSGERTRADGWGPWLGDEGSGRWIGQEGFKRALRGLDGRGPTTALTDAALAQAGSAAALPAFVATGTAPERVIAAFAPTVLACADGGDNVAGAILHEAVELLATTAASVASPETPLAVLGGLTGHTTFLDLLGEALLGHGLTVAASRGDALDGAALLAQRTDLPHERYAIRV